MSHAEIGYTGLAVLLVLIALRVPIGVSLLSVSFAGLWILAGEQAAWGALGVIPYSFAAQWELSAIPMFVFMGFLCYHAGLTTGLFGAARMWLSGVPGGLAIAGILGATGFSAVTGSSVACAAAMGRIAVPEMMAAKYDIGLATGSIAAAGTIGSLIPPSILFILYGIIANVPITALFLGGIGPGLLTAAGYIAVVILRARLDPSVAPQLSEKPTWNARFSALVEVWPILVVMLGVFGGLFGGVFTPTQAGAIGAAFSLVISLVKRSISWRAISDSLRETLQVTGSIFVIAIGANMLTRFMAFSGAGDQLSEFITSIGANKYVLLTGITAVYLLLGMFLDAIGAMLLTLPILLPILKLEHYDLIWFGVLLAKYLEVGMITPPVGLNVFVLKGVVGEAVTTARVFWGVMPFILSDIVCIVALIAIPEIITYIPAVFS